MARYKKEISFRLGKNLLYYKIVDKINDEYKVLFHGLNGSKKIKINEWIRAELKIVTDDDPKRSTSYLSGWHIMESYEEAESYLSRFTNVKNKAIVECEAKNIRKKEHSPHNVYLAEFIKIKE